MIEHLNSCKTNFGSAPRKFSLWSRLSYLKVQTPDWVPAYPDEKLGVFFQQLKNVLRDGTVVWGQIIQANGQLFSDGDEDCPGELLYSLEDSRRVDVEYLKGLAHKLYSLKGTTPDHDELAGIADYLTDEMIRVYGLVVPRILSPNLKCHISTTYFIRKYLPEKKLCSTLLPIIVNPTDPMVAVPLPERFWPKELIDWWCRK